MKIKINKLKDDAILPNRKHYNDAGADVAIYTNVRVPANSVIKIPLGWSIEIPDGYFGLLMPRSSLASNGYTVIGTPIDSGYRGEVLLMLHNRNDDDTLFLAGERLGQLVILPVVLVDFTEELEQSRGTGGFGSTGLK